jgi:Raf kinase inhibitor-like YbhB/YbcL family protein
LAVVDRASAGPPGRVALAAAFIVAIVWLVGCGGGDRPRQAVGASAAADESEAGRVGQGLVGFVERAGGERLTRVACQRDERMAEFWRCRGRYPDDGTAYRDLRFRVRTTADGRVYWARTDDRAQIGETAWPLPEDRDTITVESPAWRFGSTLPKRFTCDGENISPPLRWKHVPRAARSLAIVVEDKHLKYFTHWIVVDIPPTTRHVEAGLLPDGARELRNAFGELSYRGPCPARGDLAHAFVYIVLALRERPNVRPDASQAEIRQEIMRVAIARGDTGAGYP